MQSILRLLVLLVALCGTLQAESYNDRYYGPYGPPLEQIRTPKKLLPYKQTPRYDYYHQFGYGRGFTPHGHWFTYHFVIEF